MDTTPNYDWHNDPNHNAWRPAMTETTSKTMTKPALPQLSEVPAVMDRLMAIYDNDMRVYNDWLANQPK